MAVKNKYAFRFNVEGLYNTFLGLPPRQQMIALVVVGFIVLLIVILPVTLAGGKLSSMEEEIINGREQMSDVVREIEDYNRIKARLASIEGLLKSGFDTSISTTLENLAAQSGVKENMDSLKERPLTPSDIFDEGSVDVRMTRVTLQQIIDFLYKIEGEKTRLLRIKQIQLKPRFDNKKLLDASFQVSTFRLSGEAS